MRALIEDIRDCLGLTRKEMPQIPPEKTDAFLQFAEQQRIHYDRLQLPAGQLHPTQKNLDEKKVKALMDLGLTKLKRLELLISYEHQILDGHHRWAAVERLDPERLCRVIRFHLPITDLIGLARAFNRQQPTG